MSKDLTEIVMPAFELDELHIQLSTAQKRIEDLERKYDALANYNAECIGVAIDAESRIKTLEQAILEMGEALESIRILGDASFKSERARVELSGHVKLLDELRRKG